MKAKRFIYVVLAVASCGFVTSCDEEDEPYDPTSNPYYDDMVVYNDTRTESERQGELDYFLDFNWTNFDNYRVEITRKAGGGTYKIYIPKEGAEIKFNVEYKNGEVVTLFPDIIVAIAGNEVLLSENVEEYTKDTKIYNKYTYTADCLTISFDRNVKTNHNSSLTMAVGENAGAERTIHTIIMNNGDTYKEAHVIFVQEGN